MSKQFIAVAGQDVGAETRGARYVDAMTVEPGFRRLRGDAAIEWAESNDELLCKFADPSEGWRDDLDADEARDVTRQDSTLIYVDVPAAFAVGDPEV